MQITCEARKLLVCALKYNNLKQFSQLIGVLKWRVPRICSLLFLVSLSLEIALINVIRLPIVAVFSLTLCKAHIGAHPEVVQTHLYIVSKYFYYPLTILYNQSALLCIIYI